MKTKSRFLALLPACLLGLAGISAPAASARQAPADPSAQSAPAAAKVSRNRDSYVIYHAPDGETFCRHATPAEELRIARRGKGERARLIYDGAPRLGTRKGGSDAKSPYAYTTTGQALLPSAGLRIILHGTAQLEANPTAKNAFIVAANRWENVISTPITVVFDVDYGTTFFGEPYSSPNILGQTGSSVVTRSISEVRSRLLQNNPTGDEAALYNALPGAAVPVEFNGGSLSTSSVAVTFANARALGLASAIADPDSLPIGQGDAGIGFNSAHPFDFNPDDGITPNTLDFDAVVVHEIGHALGFSSRSGRATFTSASAVSMWDLYRFRPGAATGLSNFTTAPRVMTVGADTNDPHVYFNNRVNSFGSTELQLSQGGPSGDGGDRKQSSHWKDDSFGPFIGIMDPTLTRGRREVITANDLNAIDTFGYTVGGAAPPPPPPPAPPANDNFSNAVALSGLTGVATGTNVSATKEPGEPNHAQNAGGRSVWYRWTAPATGTVTFDTQGSAYDTTLAVYTGGAVSALTLVFGNDDIDTQGGNLASRVQFGATAGAVYQVAVDGYDADSGAVTLNWSQAAPPPTPTPTPTPAPTPVPNVTISGRIADAQGNGVGGARVSLAQSTGLQFTPATTDSNGNYAFQNVAGGTYTITPIRDGVSEFSPNAATLLINSNQAVNFTARPGNAIDGTQLFVSQHYRDFLGREPDAAGLQFWADNIERCAGSIGCRQGNRVSVSAAFFLSIEFQETGYLVYRTHKAAFGDLPGKPVPVRREEFLPDTERVGRGVMVGVGDWQARLEANKAAFAQEFVARARFLAEYPASMTAAEFIDKLNRNAGGVLNADERAQLVAELGPNPSDAAARARALRRVAENGALRSAEFNRAFVLMQYFGYLRRNPDDAPDADYSGWQFWLDQLNRFNGNFVTAEMVRAFIESIEYRRRFAP